MKFSALALAIAPLFAHAAYHITEIPGLGKDPFPVAINNVGQVIGGSEDGHSWLWQAGAGTTDLGNVLAYSISDAGTIVGAMPAGAGSHAFTYSNGQFSILQDGWAVKNVAQSINSAGQIVGVSADGHGGSHLVTWAANGSSTDLGTFGGLGVNGAVINASGTILASGVTADRQHDSIIYANGVATHLQGAPGFSPYAVGLADNGDVVGQTLASDDPSNDSSGRGWLLHNGVYADIGNLGSGTDVYAISGAGDVVGFSDPEVLFTHAFVYSGGVMHDLNDMLDTSSAGWLLHCATLINNNGWIVGDGTSDHNGIYLAIPGTETSLGGGVVAAPVPEPSTWALMLTGLLAVAQISIRRRPGSARS